MAEVLGRHGRLDILINAGDEPADFAPLEQKALAVGGAAQAVLWAMQAAFPAMRENGGRIVNLVAPLGDSLNRQAADAVAASEAIKSLTRSAAEEWGCHNILVNALATAADTASFRQLRERAPAAVDALVAASPMTRMGDPVEDIGGAVMLLLGESGRFLTGHVLYADGGQHLTPTPYEA
ncbi:MAG: SDR family NAD(P)-dependent oxidoreductase, partial [Solimonas sp.]